MISEFANNWTQLILLLSIFCLIGIQRPTQSSAQKQDEEGDAVQQETEKKKSALDDAFFVPKNISWEAQNALKKFSRSNRSQPLPMPTDIKRWTKKQIETENTFAQANLDVVAEFKPTIDERQIGGVSVLDIKPQGLNLNDKRLLVYTHGGAYTLFSARSTLISSVPVAADTGLRVISVDYTLAPHAQWNEITDQVIRVIQALVRKGYPLDKMAMYGDSAGGGLAAGTVLKLRDRGIGMPAAVVLWSPWSDITNIGDSYTTLEHADPLLFYPKNLKHAADAYAPSPAQQHNPYVSPVNGDYSKGFPPTLIQVGTKEIFLSNAVRHYQALDQAGIEVKLDPYDGMWHVFQAFNHRLPESKLARQKMSKFLDKYLRK